MSMCQECTRSTAIMKDPRIPPLDTGFCLCADCFHNVTDEMIDELAGEQECLMNAQRECAEKYERIFDRPFVDRPYVR
jgi:hypothetical protein